MTMDVTDSLPWGRLNADSSTAMCSGLNARCTLSLPVKVHRATDGGALSTCTFAPAEAAPTVCGVCGAFFRRNDIVCYRLSASAIL